MKKIKRLLFFGSPCTSVYVSRTTFCFVDTRRQTDRQTDTLKTIRAFAIAARSENYSTEIFVYCPCRRQLSAMHAGGVSLRWMQVSEYGTEM